MAFKCIICGKKPHSGKTVSHSKKRSNRVFRPNLQKKHIILDGKKIYKYVCTSCLRSGKVLIA